MAYIVRLPGLGMQQDRATIVEWHATPGDSVSEGEVIGEIETEKSIFEIEAKEDGVLRRVYADVGDVRKPNQPLAIVAEADEDVSALESTVEASSVEASSVEATATGETATGDEAAEAEPEDSTGSSRVAPRARKRAAELGVDVDAVEGTGPEGAVLSEDVERAAGDEDSGGEAEDEDASGEPERVAPRARRRAEELGVELTGIEGTGPGGAVTVDDVEDAATEGPSRTVREERPFSALRRTVSERLQASHRDAVHVTLDRSADAEALLDAADAADRDLDPDVSMFDVLLVALSRSLAEHPEFNATVEDETLTIYEKQNVGIAVDFERGLVTPVLDDVGEKPLGDIAEDRRALTERVLDDEFTPADLEGGTFTVSNLGPYGVEAFDPIINPPQVAILGVNALQERMVSVDGTRQLRRRLPLSLSFDHRAVDGADAARFLETLVQHVEEPRSLLPDEVEVTADASRLPERSVSARTEGGLAGVVSAGAFDWSFDEPENLGGSGTAPTPVDYFVGSIASCLATSIEFQASKRELDLSEVRVDADGNPKRGSLESVELSVTLVTDADDDAVDQLVELGKRGCYVTELVRDDLPVEVTWTREPSPSTTPQRSAE